MIEINLEILFRTHPFRFDCQLRTNQWLSMIAHLCNSALFSAIACINNKNKIFKLNFICINYSSVIQIRINNARPIV